LRALRPSFVLTVVAEANQGAGQARNSGAAKATGELLLFLDDDMEADPEMLREHERSHDAGADLVLGDLPLHPQSPDNLLSRGVGTWARERADRLSRGTEVPLADLLTGQVSVSRTIFDELGGFDHQLTRDGLFGGEDIDFGYRVRKAGLRIVFNPRAVSHQFYDVDPAEFLKRSYEAGRSEQELALKHPERAGDLETGLRFTTRRGRLLTAPFIALPDGLFRPVRGVIGGLARRGADGPRLQRMFLVARTVERQRGIRSARRATEMGSVVVLAYHALEDLTGDPVLAPYGVTPEQLNAQFGLLARCGFTFVDLEALVDALAGRRRLPRRAVLVTFDDAYSSVLEGMETLRRRHVPALVFVVAGRVGQTNDWDRPRGARSLSLLDAAGLAELVSAGVELGSHGTTHRPLTMLNVEELTEELAASVASFGRLGLPSPRALSYPHGAQDDDVAAAVRDAGFRAAFTVTPGVVQHHSRRWALPRLEVLATDTPRRLILKVLACRWPGPVRDRVLSALGVSS
jgi:peptidoglycan/xylan/chitin deacetylase (PgdA/CDA1 family)/GT2 family glycosyltransferase